MVDPRPDIASGLEFLLGAASTRKVSRGSIFRCLLPGRQGVAGLVRAQARAISCAEEETVGHNCLLHGLKNRANENLRCCLWPGYPQLTWTLGGSHTGEDWYLPTCYLAVKLEIYFFVIIILLEYCLTEKSPCYTNIQDILLLAMLLRASPVNCFTLLP